MQVHDTQVHDTQVHDTQVHDTQVHDTQVHDTQVHDNAVHNISSWSRCLDRFLGDHLVVLARGRRDPVCELYG
jgi:hypothetical protein